MLEKIDKFIFYVVIGLIIIGIVFVYSSSFYVAIGYEVSPYYFAIKQIIWAVIALGLLFFFIYFDYKKIKKFVKPIVFITIFLLLAVFIPGLGKTSGGARRWLDFRIFNFNPSEIAKITVIIYLSYILTKKQAKLDNFTFGILPPLLLVAAVFFIILMQSGFSIAVVLLFVAFVIFFVGGASIKHIVSILVLSLPILVVFIYKVAYRLERIFAYLNPWEDASGRGYHIIQSLKAFANGGLLGVGLGNSSQKFFKLPTPHTDFIFSIIAEETGLVGAIIVIALYLIFLVRGIMVAWHCKDKFGQLLAFGIVTLFTSHAILNIGIATGVVPPTGVSLPFISYGGSSIVVMAIASGILLNISAQNQKNTTRISEVEDLVQEAF